MVEKQVILQNIANDLNSPDNPWQIVVEGDQIIATWKWMDATFFSLSGVSNEFKEFKFIVTLLDDYRWKENCYSTEKSSGFGKNGMKFGTSFGSGSMSSTSHSFGGFGIDRTGNNNNGFGMVTTSFSTGRIKQPIRDYLTRCGWKKKGFFG